jgi:hypothetical protein
MLCSECKFSVNGHPSTHCPLAGRLPDKLFAAFTAGCSLAVAATAPIPPRPATTAPSPALAHVPTPKARTRHPRGPNATETRYRDTHLAGKDARYEALTFHMSNGKRYTPDWVVFEDGRPVACHEVKGSYRLHSHGRAQLAFNQCRIEFPGLEWIWHEENT